MALENWNFVETNKWPLGENNVAEFYESGEGNISDDDPWEKIVYLVDGSQRIPFLNDLKGYSQYLNEKTGNYTIQRSLPNAHPFYYKWYVTEAGYVQEGKPGTTSNGIANGQAVAGQWTTARVSATYRPLDYNVIPESSLNQAAIGAVTIDSAGTGYVVGDVVVIEGGTIAQFGTTTTLLITAVNGAGGVTGASILAPGAFSIEPSNPQNPAGGTGTGLAVSLNYYADEKARYVLRDYGFTMEQLSVTGLLHLVSRPSTSDALDSSPGFPVPSQQVDYTWVNIPARIYDQNNNQVGDALQFIPPNLATVLSLGGCVNSAYFDGHPPGTVLFCGFIPRRRKPVLNTGRYLWDLTYRFTIKDQGRYEVQPTAVAGSPLIGQEIGCNFIFDVVNYRWDLATTNGMYKGVGGPTNAIKTDGQPPVARPTTGFPIYPSGDLNQLFVITQTSQGI